MKVKILKLFITGAVSYMVLAGFGSFCFAMEDDYGKTKTNEIENSIEYEKFEEAKKKISKGGLSRKEAGEIYGKDFISDMFKEAKERVLKNGLSRKEADEIYGEKFFSDDSDDFSGDIYEKFWVNCACNRAKKLYDEACKKIKEYYENSEYKEFAEYIVPGKTDIDDIKSILTTSPDVSFTKDQMEKAIKSIELKDFDKAFGFLIYFITKSFNIKAFRYEGEEDLTYKDWFCKKFLKLLKSEEKDKNVDSEENDNNAIDDAIKGFQEELQNHLFEEEFSKEVSRVFFYDIVKGIYKNNWSKKILTKKLGEIKFKGKKLKPQTVDLFIPNVNYIFAIDLKSGDIFKNNAVFYSQGIINKFVNDKLKKLKDRHENVYFYIDTVFEDFKDYDFFSFDVFRSYDNSKLSDSPKLLDYFKFIRCTLHILKEDENRKYLEDIIIDNGEFEKEEALFAIDKIICIIECHYECLASLCCQKILLPLVVREKVFDDNSDLGSESTYLFLKKYDENKMNIIGKLVSESGFEKEIAEEVFSYSYKVLEEGTK